jgi:DNA-binding PadR family transcriptional regulator
MSTRLVILGLLLERPLHGYELKQTIEERMGDWTSIAFGSIYFALGKLAEEGLIEQAATEQEGGRPSRTIYRLTDAGRAEFMRLLREVWREVERTYFTVDIGLYFMHALPAEEVQGYLRERIAQLEDTLTYVAAHRAEQMERIEGLLSDPKIAAAVGGDMLLRVAAVFDHSQVHLKAELDWTRDLLRRLEGTVDG